ncbi:MAG TPA: aspartate kinase [Acidimicrobiales bacterium]|nr:aspartate kinase [Acidimicrobiales bacterium]
MSVVVQKYGGTSVGDADRIREVADHIARTRRLGHDVVVAVSAMGKETDELLHLADQVSTTKPGREMDMLVTAGERKATALVTMALADLGVPALSFTGSQVGFLTDTTHRNAKILEIRPERLRQAVAEGKVPVVGGAQGMSTAGDITFLGRGGTDTTAVALAAVLGAEVCELYTDVTGLFTADPRVVPDARRLPELSFEELLEMTASGLPKPAMRAVEFARNHGVKLHIRSAFTWEHGTWVREEQSMEQAIISGVTHDISEAKVTITRVPDQPGIAAQLFRGLADSDVNVDMIVQNTSVHGTTDISFTVPLEQLKTALSVTESVAPGIGAGEVETDSEVGRVSLIGAGMKSNPGVAATMFETLAREGVNIEMISTSSIRISCVVREEQVEKAVQALHDAFGLAKG